MKKWLAFFMVLWLFCYIGLDIALGSHDITLDSHWYVKRVKEEDPWYKDCRFKHSIPYCVVLEYTCDWCYEGYQAKREKKTVIKDSELAVWCDVCKTFTEN